MDKNDLVVREITKHRQEITNNQQKTCEKLKKNAINNMKQISRNGLTTELILASPVRSC